MGGLGREPGRQRAGKSGSAYAPQTAGQHANGAAPPWTKQEARDV
jgi:hypothetical protein